MILLALIFQQSNFTREYKIIPNWKEHFEERKDPVKRIVYGLMNTRQEQRYKDQSPTKTVANLKKILHDNGIEVNEKWLDSSSIGTYSLRVTIKGSSAGSNGKGVTKDLALASAYAELLERMQNNLLFRNIPAGKEHYIFADEKLLTAEQIIEQNDCLLSTYFISNGMGEKSKPKKINYFMNLHYADYYWTGLKNQYICLPFYSYKEKRTVYLPATLIRHLYGSNGMCAGNTPYEALVQGMSEIFERVSQLAVMRNQIPVKEISSDIISKYPYVNERLEAINNEDGLSAKIIDCSLFDYFPVVALIVVEKNTGNYGVRFGSHPDIGVAMERTLTEATQGRSIEDFAKSSFFEFQNASVGGSENINNALSVGIAQYPSYLLGDIKDVRVQYLDVSEKTNKEQLMDSFGALLNEYDCDVLVRDVSFLGFPSYQILIPGISEIATGDELSIKARNTKFYVINSLLTDISKINKQNVDYVISVLKESSKKILDSPLQTYFINRDTSHFPCEKYGKGVQFFLALCYVMKEDYHSAKICIERIIEFLSSVNLFTEDREVLLLFYYYLSGMDTLHDSDKVVKYLTNLFDEATVNFLTNLIDNPQDVLVHFFKNDGLIFDRYYDKSALDTEEKLFAAQNKNMILQSSLSVILEG